MKLNFSYVKAGARMVIHDPEEQPLIDEFGIAINPATYTLAAITEVSIQNKNKSNSTDCIIFLPYVFPYKESFS